MVARSYFVGIREFSDYAPIAECRTFERKTRGGRSRRSARDAGGLLKEGKALQMCATVSLFESNADA